MQNIPYHRGYIPRNTMSVFGPSQWEINTLVIISGQLHSIQKKLDVLLSASSVPAEQISALHQETAALKTKTDSLTQAIKEQEKG